MQVVLLIILVALLTISTSNAYLTAHVIPAVLLFFVLLHTTENFLKKMTMNTFLVFASFIILLVSELLFLLILKSISFYFIGSTLRVLATCSYWQSCCVDSEAFCYFCLG